MSKYIVFTDIVLIKSCWFMYMFEGHKGSTTLQGFRLLCSDFGPICIWNAQAHFQVGDLLSIQLGKWRMS